MLPFLTLIYGLALPYWDTLRKRFSREGISSLTIIHSSNLIGHPIGILLLILLGLFALPFDWRFYIFWFVMISIEAVAITLHLWGLVESKFFAVQILNRLTFVTSGIAAILVLGESITLSQFYAVVLAVLGVVCVAWPDRVSRANLVWDKGVLYVLVSVLLSGVATVFYKMATFYTPEYSVFLSGRFIGDLLGWGIVWIGISVIALRRNPFLEVLHLTRSTHGRLMMAGGALSTLLSSWLIYKLPVTMFVMLSTVAVPTAYFLSKTHYKERINTRTWIGSLLIIAALTLFLV